MEKLIIAGKEFESRLFLGTGKFNSNQLMEEAILASGTEMVTVAMKRIELDNKEDDMLKHIIHPHIQLLPNTSGVRTAEEAVFAAQMAREAFGTNWLKLEIHPDPRYLLPDSTETLKATETGIRGIALLPGRPDPVQAPGRSRSSYRNAAGCPHRYEQGIADTRLPAHHHRAEQRAGGSGCRHRCTEPCR